MTEHEIDPGKRYVVPMLRITQCPDRLRWYAGLVGHLAPHRGLWAHFGMNEYLSNEPSGATNFVQVADCQRVKVSVSGRKLAEWPYAPVAAMARLASDRFEGDVFVPEIPVLPRVKAEPKTCAASCNAVGICQALDDCQDKPRIDAELGRVRMVAMQSLKSKDPLGPAADRRFSVAVGQSRRASVNEAITNIVLGFGISVAITAVLMPAFGHHVTLSENVAMTFVFTVASFVRAYAVRRGFNWWLLRQGKAGQP